MYIYLIIYDIHVYVYIYIYIYIYIFMLSCVDRSKAPPHTISQQDTTLQCPISTSYECYINLVRNRFKPVLG